MNSKYKEILTLLNTDEIDSIEFLECFSNSNNSQLSKETVNKIVCLLNELRKENDPFAAYYLYLFKKYSIGCDDKFMFECLKESSEAGYFRAIIRYFRFLMEKFDSLAFKTTDINSLEDIYIDLTVLVVNNIERFTKSKKEKDRYYLDEKFDFKYYIDGALDFYDGYQKYLCALQTKEMTIDIAKNFANVDGWFLIVIYNIPAIKNFYIKILNWLVDHNEYDYLVKLLSFEKKCEPLFPYGKYLFEANNNKLLFLSKGVENDSIECCLKYLNILIDICSEYYYKRSANEKKTDLKAYTLLDGYFKNNGTLESKFKLIQYYVNDFSVASNIAAYDKCFDLILDICNNEKEALLNYQINIEQQLFYMCYAYSHIDLIKSRGRCKECLELYCELYFRDTDIEGVVKGICFVRYPLEAKALQVDNSVLYRFNLLKDKKLDEFLDFLF